MNGMSAISRICVGVLALGAMAIASAADLLPGSPAPKIDVKTWVKGTPVAGFEKDKLYVVEFWATWCGPCKQSIPHLTELAKKNKDVTFVGVSIWEDEKPVAPFVKEMGDKMDYNVAYGGNKDGMAQTWMQAAGQNGIPSAFIVKEGNVVWIGHPMEMEKPLEQVKAGTLDVKAERAKIEQQIVQAKKSGEIRKQIAEIQKLHTDGKVKEAKAGLDKLVKENPQLAGQADQIRGTWQAVDDPAGFEKKLDALIKKGDQQSRMQLMNLAMSLMGEPKARAMAVKAAEGVGAGAKDDDLLTNYQAAYMLHQLKEDAKALPYAEKAVKAIPTSQFKDNADAKTAIEGLLNEIKKTGSK